MWDGFELIGVKNRVLKIKKISGDSDGWSSFEYNSRVAKVPSSLTLSVYNYCDKPVIYFSTYTHSLSHSPTTSIIMALYLPD